MKNIEETISVLVCLILITFIKFSNSQLLTNKGKKFVIGFIHNDVNATLRLSLSTQAEKDVNVNITTPLFNSSYYSLFVIRKGQVHEAILDKSLQGAFGVENKGIVVEADDEITVYASNTVNRSMDDFLVFPNEVLGHEYYVMSWSNLSSYMVVATQDQTNLTMTLGESSQSVFLLGTTINAGESIDVQLSRYETLTIWSNSGDFTGTRIYGNITFAVFGGNACTTVGGTYCDHMAEQMLPVDKWGKEFITISMPGCTSADFFKIVTGFDNTTVDVFGITTHTLVKSGDFFTFSLQDSSFKVVKSDRPISMFMFSSGSCGTIRDNGSDPSMVIIPAVRQFSSNYITFSTNSSDKIDFENYVAIVVDEKFKDGFRLDGLMLQNANWSSVYGSTSYVYTEFLVSTDVHSIFHTNPSVKFAAFSTGRAMPAFYSYAYLLGMDFPTDDEICTECRAGNKYYYKRKIFHD